MAKEYQMLFRLGAKLGGDFSGTFSSAQKILQTTQKQISDLNKTQSDITAYQRQQKSIENVNEKLELYKRQLGRVQEEIKQTGTKTAEQANREDELQQKIKNTEQAIADKTFKLNQMGHALSEAGVNMSDLSGESGRLAEQIQNLQQQEELAGLEAANLGEQGASAFDAIGSALASAGIAAGLSKIADAYRECVTASMEFGYSMSTVEALSGASASEMERLTETAKYLGATTAFTANESAQAMTYMGMAGWNAEQMMSGMDGVLNLAAASGEDLANVSDIVTDNLTAFRLTAADTTHFADVLAAAATNSNTSVGIMGETFSGSAAIAGALGYSIEDVAVAVGEMANAGVKGSVAGTALKNMFNGLLSGATLTSGAFGEVEYSAVNADGTMKGFSETIDGLRGYFEQMTDAERVSNAMAIAGQRGYNGLLAILNTTDEDYRKLSDSINNCAGSAQKMANIKLDNLQGDVTLLSSAADGLKNTVGSLYEDELRKLAQIGTTILTGINNFCEKNPVVVKSIMMMAAELGGVLVVYNAFNAAKKVKNALSVVSAAVTGAETVATNAQTTAQLGLNAAMDANPIGIIIGLVGALTVGITALVEVSKKHKEQIENSLIPASQRQSDELERMQAEYEAVCDKFGETSDQALRLKYQIDDATAAFENSKQTIGEFNQSCEDLIANNDELIGSYRDFISETDNSAMSTLTLIQRLQDLAEQNDKTAQTEEQMRALFAKIQTDLPDLGISFEDITKNTKGFTEAMKAAAKQKADDEKYLKSQQAYADALVHQDELIRKLALARQNLAQYKTEGGFGGVTYTDIDAARDAQAVINDLAAQYRENFDLMADIEAQWGAMAAEAEESAQKEVSAYEGVETALGNVKERTETLVTAYNEAYQAAFDSVNGQYAIWDQAAEVSAVSSQTVNANLESQAEYWENYNTNLETLLAKADQIDGLRDLIATFADGSSDSVNMIAGLSSATGDELKSIVENWTSVKAEQEKTAESLAEVKTDFESQLDELVSGTENSVKDMIEKMNMSDEAREAALKTINSYSEGIKSGLANAESAAALIKDAVENTLSGLPTTVSFDMSIPSQSPIYGPQKIDLNGFAVGTNSAPSGVALVGENGPELIRFGGGEQVYTANETKMILGNSRGSQQAPITITIAPSFNVSGSMDEQVFAEMSDKLLDLIQDKLLNNSIDIKRGAYV